MHPDELLSSYDFDIPCELIASQPLADRDASRLMRLHRATGNIEHHPFRELPELLRPRDLLVLNETRVIPARLVGHRTITGGRWEGLYLGTTEQGLWRLMGQTRGRLLPGESITLQPVHATGDTLRDTFRLTLVEKELDGVWQMQPESDFSPLVVLDHFGTVPLPPYMGRDIANATDVERYQTTYASTPGAVAAPTAGLHFTPEVFDRCAARNITTAKVTLHVGIGTFRPISVEQLTEHKMHAEWCSIPPETAAAIAHTRHAGGRIVAVGTTTVRTLESVANLHTGNVVAWSGETNLFIRPPYRFHTVDSLVTNFHLPKSSLVVMLSAFAGREQMLSAYAAAVREQYRFFSYGDAMLVD
ncbi:MAG: tRNA preQ1(34) S-adenosylmethionine ribosyltransferase-isomerase QueA [Planctomycetaceae bacterium]